MLRDGAEREVSQIVVLRTLGAPQRRLLGGGRRGEARRSRSLAAGEPAPAPVFTARATVIDAAALGARDEAGRQRGSDDGYDSAVRALRTLNRVIYAHRIATADAYVSPLRIDDAIAVRVGFGNGDEVAEGRWTEAGELPRGAIQTRARRPTAALRPQERLAALLAGRDHALDCEELALRVRLDLDGGRLPAAARGLRLAIDTALVELPARHDLSERIAELRELRENAPTSDEATVRHALERLEAALRARTARGLL